MSAAGDRREIVIIGGGIIGCCSAYYLTRHPSFDPSRHKITLLEASDIAGGASGKAGGLLAQWAYPSNIVDLSFALHAELAKEHDGKNRWGYRETNCGQVVVKGRAMTEKTEKKEGGESLQKRSTAAISKLKSAKIPQDLDWIQPDLLRAYESMSGPGETAQVHPYLFTSSMAKLAQEKGAEIILGHVTNISRPDGVVESVTYTDKESGESRTVPATDVIVAAGPWTQAVLPEAPISGMRAHSVVIKPTRPVSAYALFTNIEIPANFNPAKKSRPTVAAPEIYARPDDTVYACGEGDKEVPLPKTSAEVEVDPERIQDIIDQVGSVSDELRDGEVTIRQACYLPNCTGPGGPLIGLTHDKGLYLASGHTCWGIQNGPGTGKVISEFVFDGQAKSAKIGSLDPRNQLISVLVAGLLYAIGIFASQDPNDVSILIKEAARANNESLLWGPYKPNLYFGVRPRIANSLAAGLMWAKVDDYATAQQNFRHTCEQNEGMAGYGWDEYDIRKGGRQTIHDAGNTLDLTIDFVKVPGGQHGGSWGFRVKGTPREDGSPDQPTSMVFYTTLEGLGQLAVDPNTVSEDAPLDGDVKFTGYTSELGDFSIDVTDGPDSNEYYTHDHRSQEDKPLGHGIVSSGMMPQEHLWQAKGILFSQMKTEVESVINELGTENPPPPAQLFTIKHAPGGGNVHLVQKVFTGAFEFDVLFSSGSSPEPMTSEKLTKQLEASTMSFSERFNQVLAPQAPFDSSKYSKFSKAMLSNLIGGIGFFHGDDVIDRSAHPAYEEENEGFWEETAEARAAAKPVIGSPKDLFTCVPSRPFFPRGFLWDEGFHLMPVMEYDSDLALEIIKSWFHLMDEDGWIAREQILGMEARSKVPPEFTVQYPHYANPPTLFMALEAFMDKAKSNKSTQFESLDSHDVAESLRTATLRSPEVSGAYLRSFYPLMKRHYFWYRNTQRGDIKSYDREAFSTKEGYRWRGRSVQHILTSGIDDYPRAQPPHPGELHVDLISWMGMMSRTMRRIAEYLGEEEDMEEFAYYETAITRNIDDLHWSEKEQTFCDATIDEFEESVHVCHKGYISLFPFLTGLLGPDSPHLKPVLDLINDPEELWSDYGIRSLSKKDEFYGTDENYWRSPVWININYLVLKNLYDIAIVPGSHQEQAREMYSKLRKNLVENVYREWKETGFAWEQYNPDTGKGQRTQHFTGWTSMVVNMMSMPDLTEGASTGHDEL
ncbi:FAD dependent oxidoreductase [Penicillium sp. IBT 18751x]|nr:FAD dependent oxidoreductase [Penicillium sp. IBT 18751x]